MPLTFTSSDRDFHPVGNPATASVNCSAILLDKFPEITFFPFSMKYGDFEMSIPSLARIVFTLSTDVGSFLIFREPEAEVLKDVSEVELMFTLSSESAVVLAS